MREYQINMGNNFDLAILRNLWEIRAHEHASIEDLHEVVVVRASKR